MNSKLNKQERIAVADRIMSKACSTKRLQRARAYFDSKNTLSTLKMLYAEALTRFKADRGQEIQMMVAENRYDDIDALLQGFEDSIWNS